MTSKLIPTFNNRSEQLSWYIRDICVPLLNKLLAEAEFPEIEKELVEKMPLMVVIGYLEEIDKAFGSELDKGNTDVIFKVCVTYAKSLSMDEIIVKSKKIVSVLNSNQQLKKSLFLKWNTIKKILNINTK